ncbi:hypothetical protein MAR_017319 [Mya arenaria]|uniref:Uncharacterized protein n=1 Tax=Mya arenaria TaxID=6604 RepID=A0ABY7EJI3_MYAAR|nr:hypothetical protein MAR_017319 [Mya arenaria]
MAGSDDERERLTCLLSEANSTDEDSTDDDADFEDIIGDDFGHLSDTRCDEFSDDVNDVRCDDVRCDDVSDVRVDDVSDVRCDVNDVRNNGQQYDLYKESMLWFPGGPPLTFLPFPMPDGDRRPGSCPDHECCGGHFLPPSEVIEKRLKVNIWLEHLNNVAANRERGQAKAAETRSLKKKELRTETTPGGAATSTATTHRSSARSPNHSQAQSAPDIVTEI